MKRHGFSLLELLLVLAIGSVFSLLILNIVGQINRISSRLMGTIDVHMRATLLYTQWQRDISGAFLPTAAFAKAAPAKPASSEKKDDKKSPAAQKQELPVLKRPFYAKNDEQGNCALLTFITCNPLDKYVSESIGKPQPRVVRVVYRLQQRKDDKKLYTLVRQEDGELELSAYDKQPGIRRIEMVDGIKKLQVQYVYTPEVKKEKGKTSEKPKPVTLKEWLDVGEKDTRRKIPQQVLVQCIMWDERQKRDYECTFSIELLNDISAPSYIKTPPGKPEAVDKNKVEEALPSYLRPQKNVQTSPVKKIKNFEVPADRIIAAGEPVPPSWYLDAL